MNNTEMKNKAQWVADMMKADGVKPEMITAELVMAYFDSVGRKINEIQGIYLTRNGAKDAMQKHLLSIA